MKKLLLVVLSISLFTTSCTKEEEVNPTPTDPTDPVETISFTCSIDGVAFDGSNAVTTVLTSDVLTITAVDAENTLSIKIPNVSTRFDGSSFTFQGAIGYGILTTSAMTYSNTYFDPTKGGITITEIDFDAGKISGTFFFQAQDVTPGSFIMADISSGSFENVSF